MKKAKIFYTLLVAAFIFWPFISALADVKSPEGNANPGFSKEAAGNCIFQAGGGCGAGAWFANPASQCAWEHCCKSHLYGYPTTDYTYQFKNQCSNKTDSGGNYEFEDPNKADCGTGWDCCCSTPPPAVNQNTTPPPAAPKFTIPTFQVPIDTVKLTEAVCTSTADGTYLCQVPWIGEYITGIYNYGLSVAGILAAIMLMAGGLLWLISGGDVGKITQAKELIVGSVTGLIILAASFIILVQINPNLVKFNPLSIGTIKDELKIAATKNNGTAQQYKNGSCATDAELAAGVNFYATGYYKPAWADTDTFRCVVAMQCSCPPPGQDLTKNCDQLYGNTFPGYHPCLPFPKTDVKTGKETEYCNHTRSGSAPQDGDIAGPSNCFANLPLGTQVCFKGATYTIRDIGGGIKSKRIDVWSGTDLKKALQVTGVGILKKGACN